LRRQQPASCFQTFQIRALTARWRSLIAADEYAFFVSMAGFTGEHLIAPEAILVRGYLEQIFVGLRAAGLPVFHVVLDADEDILPQRILGSDEAQAWRLAHLAEYRASRSWMTATAGLSWTPDAGHLPTPRATSPAPCPM
jgi:hypothetical protein